MSAVAGSGLQSLLDIGQEVAGYRVEAALGRQSGLARVYAARELSSERRVALKVFAPALLEGGAERKWFTRALKIQTRLRNPTVADVVSWSLEDPVPHAAFELVEGPTLEEAIAAGELDDARILTIVSAVADALEGGRARRLLYRRLHPGGILLPTEGEPAARLTDFGCARAEHNLPLIEEGRLGAFADTIPPEQINNEGPSPAGLVYSLGAVAFWAFTGQPVFGAPDQGATLHGHLEVEPRRPSVLRAELPAELDEVIVRALSKEPGRRQPSPAVFAADLARAYPDAPQTTARRRRTGPRRWPKRAAAVAGVAALVGGAAALGAATAGSQDAPVAAPKRVAVPQGSVAVPADWRVAKGGPAVEGLATAGQVTIRPASGPGGLAIGEGDRSVNERPGANVRVGATDARRVTLPGGEAYVFADRRPPVVIACLAPSASAFAGRCRRTVSTVRLEAAPSSGPVPDRAYGAAVAGVATRLDRARDRGRARLTGASSRPAQRAAAQSLAADYRTLAGALARVKPPRAAASSHRTAVSQLRRAARGYADMARAARNQAPGYWIQGRNGVASAEARVGAALRALRRAGYPVR